MMTKSPTTRAGRPRKPRSLHQRAEPGAPAPRPFAEFKADVDAATAQYRQGRRATAEAGMRLGQLWIEGLTNFLDKAGGETVKDFAPRVFGTSYSWLARCEKLWRDRHKFDEADRWMETEGRALGWTVPTGTGGVDYARKVMAAYDRHLKGEKPPSPEPGGNRAKPGDGEREDIRAATAEEFEAVREQFGDEVAGLRREHERYRAKARRVIRVLRERNGRLRAENERLRAAAARTAPLPPSPEPVRPPPPPPTAGADRPFGSATAPEVKRASPPSSPGFRAGERVALREAVAGYDAGTMGTVEGEANGGVVVRMADDDSAQFIAPAHLRPAPPESDEGGLAAQQPDLFFDPGRRRESGRV
jgi:hypothetical protein